MASENNLHNSNDEAHINAPCTSQQNTQNETYDEINSIASSANSLQMSMLETKLETEISKMGKMMQDTVSGLTDHMNQKLSEVDRKFNTLLADLTPACHNTNVNSSASQPNQGSLESGEPPRPCNSQPTLDRTQCKMKPQHYNGATDFDEFLSQFEITSDLNGWQYREKSLYLASCLTGDARSLLSELDYDGRRDYKTLIEKLAHRFGSVNRSEIYRTQLKSRVRNKSESIPELAQAIRKLVRQAYPGVNKDVIETLSIDNFIDALTDSDIRLRVRELGPKTLAEAERTALRLESHKIADRQRSRLVGQIDTGSEQNKNGNQWDSSTQLNTLQKSIDSLSGHVKNFSRQNRPNEHSNKFAKTPRSQNNSYPVKNGRDSRLSRNNPPPLHRPNNDQYRGNNNHHNIQQYQPARRFNTNDNAMRGRHNNNRYNIQYNNKNDPGMALNNQENWNQSGWRATTRHH